MKKRKQNNIIGISLVISTTAILARPSNEILQSIAFGPFKIIKITEEILPDREQRIS